MTPIHLRKIPTGMICRMVGRFILDWNLSAHPIILRIRKEMDCLISTNTTIVWSTRDGWMSMAFSRPAQIQMILMVTVSAIITNCSII